jgi:hypothetical protein
MMLLPRAQPMKTDDVAKMLLSSATEDRFGLYEAIWELNGRFPTEPLGRKYDLAREVLLDLHRKGWIRFERVTIAAGKQRAEAIKERDVLGVLDNPASWYPEYEGATVVFVSTERGTHHYMTNGKP